jgi:hypothetical protein
LSEERMVQQDQQDQQDQQERNSGCEPHGDPR